MESWYATCTPALALVAPGAARGKADAGPAGELAIGVSGHRGAALLPAGDKADRVFASIEGIQNGKVAFAGNAEGGGDALGDQQINEVVSGAERVLRMGHGDAAFD